MAELNPKSTPPPDSQAEQFMRLFLANQRRFYGLILALVPNAADADDLLQETSSLMWQKFSEFTPGTDFAAWGLRFARNVVFSFHKKRRSQDRVFFSDEVLNSVAEEVAQVSEETDDRHAALRGCLEKLSGRARHLIDLRYEPGATGKSVAARVGKSLPSIYRALARIHQALIECVERKLAAEGHP